MYILILVIPPKPRYNNYNLNLGDGPLPPVPAGGLASLPLGQEPIYTPNINPQWAPAAEQQPIYSKGKSYYNTTTLKF